MSSPTVLALGAALAVSAISLVGALTLVLRPDTLRRAQMWLISFAAGGLLGDALLHLLPEIAEHYGGLPTRAVGTVLGGILAFFVLERVLHWHHAHIPTEDVTHPVAVTNLVGDALHNFVDGAVMAGAFLASPKLGLATAVAVALHEIPQELGDFAILVHAGLKPRRALALNALTALAALAGAGAALVLAGAFEGLEPVLLAFTAGGFLYIACTDLIPDLHKEADARRSLLQMLGLAAGLAVMAGLLRLE